MESWFTLVCVAAVYLAHHAHAVPRTSAEAMDSDLTLLTKAIQDPVDAQEPEKRDGLVVRQAEDNPIDTSLDSKSKSVKDSVKLKMSPRMVADNVGVRKERVLENEGIPKLDTGSSSSLKVSFPEDPKQAMATKLEDDSIRSKKSPSMRDSYTTSPHLTTVCIQVRSDQHPQVVCGPQVNDDKEIKPNHSARFASPGSEYYQQQLYARSSQNPLPMPLRPAAASGMPQYIQQSQLPKAAAPPTAAKGPVMYPVMRSDEPSALSPGQPQFQPNQPQFQPNQPQLPGRLIPGSPSSVVVHKQFYQGRQIPGDIPQGYQAAPSWSAMRLNCMPDYYQLPFGSNPLLRSASLSPELYQIGDQVIPVQQQASLRMAQDPQAIDNSMYLMDAQARQAMSDQALGSIYGYSAADPLLGATYIGEDGRTYLLDESQARAAMSEEQMLMRQLWEQQQYQRASSSMSVEQLQKLNLEQQEELREYKSKMQQLQGKLKDIEQRAAVDDVKIKKVEIHEENVAKPEVLPNDDVKKIDPAKTSKRQTHRSKS